MNSNMVLGPIDRLQHTPIPDTELAQMLEGARQRFRLELVDMLGEPLIFPATRLPIVMSSRERSSSACGVKKIW